MKQGRMTNRRRLENLKILSLCLPALGFFLVFNYLPMAGIIVAFKDFNVSRGILGSEWAGLQNFKFLFRTVDAWRITRNTLGYNAVFICLNTGFSLFLALSLDALRNRPLIKTYQTVMFFPHFLSWVVSGYMLYAFLQTRYGLVNGFLETLTGTEVKINWYMNPGYWVFILPLMNLWKRAGFLALIYYAGLSTIDPAYYQAAEIDGASRWQIVTRIKIPLLGALILMMILLAIGRIFYADFGLFYNLPRNIGMLFRTTDVIDTYVYRALKVTGDIGMAAAAGFYQSVVGFCVVMTTNWAVRRISPEKALF
jgi:putative aldouronate transport system permease protein